LPWTTARDFALLSDMSMPMARNASSVHSVSCEIKKRLIVALPRAIEENMIARWEIDLSPGNSSERPEVIFEGLTNKVLIELKSEYRYLIPDFSIEKYGITLQNRQNPLRILSCNPFGANFASPTKDEQAKFGIIMRSMRRGSAVLRRVARDVA